jgi:hypothetical protein
MTVNEKVLHERLSELQKQIQSAQIRLQQAQADVYAISGAIQEVNYWLGKIKKDTKGTE